MSDTPNNTIIELTSVSRLKDCLVQTKRVIPNIKDTDKEPLWDGHLYLYHTENKINNEDFAGRIPIQVKGTCKGNTKRSQATYSVSMNNLRQYKRDGGIIFFVVVVSKNLKTSSIYYNSLLPFDIARILQEKGDQSETTIYLNRFPKGDTAKIVAILKDFIKHREKQMSTAEQGLKIREMLYNGKSMQELNIKCFKFDTNGDIFRNIGNTLPSYIYAEDNNGLQIPIETAKFYAISTEIVQKIIIGKDVYDCTIEITNAIEGQTFNIAHSISIFNPRKKADVLKINFKLSDDLGERILALKIIKSLYEYKSITIPRVLEAGGADLSAIDIIEITKMLEFHEKASLAFEKLNITNKFNWNNFNSQDCLLLNSLVASIIDKKPIDSRIKFKHSIGTISISGCRIIVQVVNDEDNNQYFLPLHKTVLEARIEYKGSDFKYPITVCSIFKREDFAKIDNLLPEHIYQPIEELGYYAQTAENINLMVLEMIAAYDMSHKDYLLDVAIKILEWLIAHDEQTVYYINYYQCIKRKRALTDDELSKILEMKKKTDSNVMLFGINVLLDNNIEAEIAWNNIDDVGKDNMKNFPIYTLYTSDSPEV